MRDFSGGKRALAEALIMRLHGRRWRAPRSRFIWGFWAAARTARCRPPAGGLEPGRGLAAAAGMRRLEVERRLADQAVKEPRGAGGGGAHAAQLRDRAHGLGLLGREAGLDGDARMIGPDHLAGLAPAVAAAPGVAVASAAPSRRSRSHSARLSKRSAACGESSSRIASRRQNLRCGHSACMALSPAFRLLDFH